MRMDVGEARKVIYDLTKFYFQNAAVTYAKQSFRVKPTKPLVTLSFGSITRPLNPPVKVIDGRPVSFYPSTMMVQIDLFTKGKQRSIAEGITPVMENTAANDLMKFADFLGSEYAVQYCHKKDIAIVLLNTVQDLTDLINDTNFEYRAMLELELRFTSYALGYTGTLSIESVKHEMVDPITGEPVSGGDIQDDVSELLPEVETTISGGGNDSIIEDEKDYFTNVRINNKLVKEENKP